jgi:hypothetical protein
LIIAYFTYVAAVAPIFISHGNKRWLPAVVAAAAAAVLLGLSRGGDSHIRDWIPLALTFTAFRELNWFTPTIRDHHPENAWIGWARGCWTTRISARRSKAWAH